MLVLESVAYIMDPIRGNCSLSSISAQGFDSRTAADGVHVRIRTSREFFYFDSLSYNYEGTVSKASRVFCSNAQLQIHKSKYPDNIYILKQILKSKPDCLSN
ncbi:hypothetical protein CHS0354_003419 [Potamilus streckersoni]|uniref:LolA-like domain-containing protein n=1 Tax=Potamilus streckersoni TaxID=2493646 RepID=A0AAE0W054_9BIVA|nr:hypothetical protein CHS0354_003419 [Potamilus streckersoni]